MSTSPDLSRIIARLNPTATAATLQSLARAAQERHGACVCAILFYGSCLRSGDHYDGLVDLYLLVDSYTSCYGRRPSALLNWLLPPNVFYLEVPHGQRVLRAKYAIVSLRDFQRGTSMRWFHSYLWGRFAQPVGIAYVRDKKIATTVYQCLSQAVITFVTRLLPRLPPAFTAMQLWQQGLRLSYQAELRAEKTDRAAHLVEISRNYYARITPAALQMAPYPITVDDRCEPPLYHAHIPDRTRLLGRAGWLARRLLGKMLSILRLLKAFFTFQGGLDYIVWKLERHSGRRIEVPDRVRRYPLLFAWGLFWRLYRRGIFR